MHLASLSFAGPFQPSGLTAPVEQPPLPEPAVSGELAAVQPGLSLPSSMPAELPKPRFKVKLGGQGSAPPGPPKIKLPKAGGSAVRSAMGGRPASLQQSEASAAGGAPESASVPPAAPSLGPAKQVRCNFIAAQTWGGCLLLQAGRSGMN